MGRCYGTSDGVSARPGWGGGGGGGWGRVGRVAAV